MTQIKSKLNNKVIRMYENVNKKYWLFNCISNEPKD